MATLEALFERYRTRGEIAALGEIFDRTSGGLLALGVHLVHDLVEAEDLVQATFVAAIEGAASFQAGRRLEPWLAGILARQAARVWRQRGRVPEARAELEATFDPSFAVERRELAQALDLAFERLLPAERDVLRRYLDGEAPLDIAHSQCRSAGAVRMQVLRGLEKLRRLLPSGLHAFVPIARLPRGLDAVRAEVLAQAGGAALVAPAALVPISLGMLLMSTKVVLSVVVLPALVLVSLRAWPDEEVESAPVTAVAPAPHVATAELREASALAPSAARVVLASVPEPSPAPETPARDGLWLVGDLLGLEGIDPTATEITVSASEKEVVTHGLADGTYALDVNELGLSRPGVGFLQVSASHPEWRRARGHLRLDDELRQGIALGCTELRLDLDLSPCTAVVGRIERGKPRAALAREGELVVDSWQEEEGPAFALFPPEGGLYELLVQSEGRLPLRRLVRVSERELLDVGTLVLAAGVVLEGRFMPKEFLGAGLSLTATRVDLLVEERAYEGVGLRSGRLRASLANVASDGTFRFEGLEPGDYVLSLPDYLGEMGVRSLGYSEPPVHAPASGVEFGHELGLVRFHLRGKRLALPATLLIGDAEEGGAGEARGNYRGLQLTDMDAIELLVDRRQAFSAAVNAAGSKAEWRTLSAGRSYLHEETFELLSSGTPRYGTLEISWTLPDWLELPRSVAGHFQHDTDGWNNHAEARASGCRFEWIPPGRYRLVLAPSAEQSWEPLPSFAGTLPIEVVIEPERTTLAEVEWLMGGRPRFVPSGEPRNGREALDAEVRDAQGQRSLGHFALYELDADGNLNVGSFTTLSLQWPSEFEPNLPPGSYTLVVQPEDEEPLITPFSIEAGELVDVPVRVW
jgi:RNA polymerase sigma factor (sigma-70 family)